MKSNIMLVYKMTIQNDPNYWFRVNLLSTMQLNITRVVTMWEIVKMIQPFQHIVMWSFYFRWLKIWWAPATTRPRTAASATGSIRTAAPWATPSTAPAQPPPSETSSPPTWLSQTAPSVLPTPLVSEDSRGKGEMIRGWIKLFSAYFMIYFGILPLIKDTKTMLLLPQLE